MAAQGTSWCTSQEKCMSPDVKLMTGNVECLRDIWETLEVFCVL